MEEETSRRKVAGCGAYMVEYTFAFARMNDDSGTRDNRYPNHSEVVDLVHGIASGGGRRRVRK